MKTGLSALWQRLINNWTFLRFARLALGLIITVEAFHSSQAPFVILGSLLMFQAAFNYGCCGASGCDTDHKDYQPKSSNKGEPITTFNEVK